MQIRPLMLALAMTLPVPAVMAQPALEEIVVTADFRQQAVDEIAASISVIDAETMARKNAQHLEDVLLNAPNVNIASGASRARFTRRSAVC